LGEWLSKMLKKSRLILGIILIIGISVVIGIFLIKNIKVNRIYFIEFTRFDYLNSQQNITEIIRFEKKEDIKKIMNLLNDRSRISGKIDIRARDYKVLIAYKDGKIQELSLWVNDISDSRGIIMEGNKAWYIKPNTSLKKILK
jgi:hypothetical protein